MLVALAYTHARNYRPEDRDGDLLPLFGSRVIHVIHSILKQHAY